MGKKTASAGRSAVFLTAAAAVSQGLGFAYRAALARLAGAEAMGLYQLLMSACGVMLSLSAVGLTGCASNLSARYLALDNPAALEQMRRSCMRLLLAAAGLVAAVVIPCSDPISVYLLGDARTRLGLILLPLCVGLIGMENIHKHIFYGAGMVTAPAVVELAEQLVRTAAVLGLLSLFLPRNTERTLGLMVLGMVLCEIFSAGVLLHLYRRRFSRLICSGPGEHRRERLEQILRIALPVGLTSVLGNLMGAANAALIPRKLVEGGMMRSQALGEFGIVCGMTMPMLGLPTVFLGALNLVMIPALSRLAALGQQQRLAARVRRVVMSVSVLIFPTMAIMVVLGPELAQVLFREERAGRYLPALAAAVTLSCFHGVFAGILGGIGKQGKGAAVCLLCDSVQLAFVFTVSLPGVGMGGFVAGTLISELLGAVLCAQCVKQATGAALPVFQGAAAPALGGVLAGLTGNLFYRVLRTAGMGFALSGCLLCIWVGTIYLSALSGMGVSVRDVFWGGDQ